VKVRGDVPSRDSASAVAGSAKRVEESTDHFWEAMLRVSFGVFVGESLAVGAYVLNSRDGPHRITLGAMAAASVVVASISTLLVPWIARQPWREQFSLAWTLLAGVALTTAVWLDGGLQSPLLFLILLPVAYAGLVFRPVAAAACAAISLTEVMTLAITDTATTPQRDRFLLAASVTTGLPQPPSVQ
jgi:hypothetical protein